MISVNVTRFAVARVGADRLGHVPRDGLALAVEVGGEPEAVGPLERALAAARRCPSSSGFTTYSGSEVVVGLDAHPFVGQVADVAPAGRHL